MVVLNRVTSDTTLSNTASETTMYTYSVPANMGAKAGEWLDLRLVMSLLNNSGADRTYTFRVKFGGTTYVSDNLIAVPASAFPRSMMVSVLIANDGTASTQLVGATVTISEPSTNGVVDGGMTTAPLLPPATWLYAGGTTDQSSAQTLEVTLQSDAATSTQTIIMRNALLTLT